MASHTTRPDGGQVTEARESHLWSGLIGFAAFMLVLLGGFHVIGGVVAFFDQDKYQVGASELIVSVSYRAWGIAHIALGVVMCLAGSALFWRRTWGRVVAVIVAAVSAITNLAFLSAAPVWFALMILMDILIIYAVTARADSEPEYDY